MATKKKKEDKNQKNQSSLISVCTELNIAHNRLQTPGTMYCWRRDNKHHLGWGARADAPKPRTTDSVCKYSGFEHGATVTATSTNSSLRVRRTVSQ